MPSGYSNGILAPAGGRLLFVAGQVGWDDEQEVVSMPLPYTFRVTSTSASTGSMTYSAGVDLIG